MRYIVQTTGTALQCWVPDPANRAQSCERTWGEIRWGEETAQVSCLIALLLFTSHWMICDHFILSLLRQSQFLSCIPYKTCGTLTQKNNSKPFRHFRSQITESEGTLERAKDKRKMLIAQSRKLQVSFDWSVLWCKMTYPSTLHCTLWCAILFYDILYCTVAQVELIHPHCTKTVPHTLIAVERISVPEGRKRRCHYPTGEARRKTSGARTFFPNDRRGNSTRNKRKGKKFLVWLICWY